MIKKVDSTMATEFYTNKSRNKKERRRKKKNQKWKKWPNQKRSNDWIAAAELSLEQPQADQHWTSRT